MSHPREKLNQVSTWKCSASDTMDEIVDELDGGILIRFDGGITVNNRRGRRYRSAAKMLVPFRGFGKPIATQKDSLRHVPVVEPHNRALCESLIGSLAHSMPTGEFTLRWCIDFETERKESLQFTVRGKCKTKTPSHDVTRDNKTRSV
jgi:hypothetical protein